MLDRQLNVAHAQIILAHSVVENIALFSGKRTQINLRATIQRPIHRAFAAQNRIDPVLFL
jgi:hypothetical protein